MINWFDIEPKDAVDIDLTKRLDITAPLTMEGDRCPWPWEPQQLVGAPLGQYHCGYCGEMVMAGMPHLDYRDSDPPKLEDIEEVGPMPEELWSDPDRIEGRHNDLQAAPEDAARNHGPLPGGGFWAGFCGNPNCNVLGCPGCG